MNRRVLFAMPLAVLVACSGMDTTIPSVEQPSDPSLAIEDGAHGGNPDAFFLPPLVWPTSSYANWTPNGFNKLLSPTIVVCPLDVTTVGAVLPGTACKSAAGFPVIISGTDVKKHFRSGSEPSQLPSNFEDLISHYHAQWKLTNPCTLHIVYRLTLKVGDVVLGFADVQCVSNPLGLFTVNYKKFGAGLRGTFVQIPFRIEQNAFCPGGACSTISISPAAGGTASFLPSGGTTPDEVFIPAQGPNEDRPAGFEPLPAEITLTTEACDPLNPRASDLPFFGHCFRVTTHPTLPSTGLWNAATVKICDMQIDESGPSADVFSHEQAHRITLHRLDGATLKALPHVPGCPVDTGTPVVGSLKGMLRDLVHGRVKAAGGQVLAMLAPTPLYARRRLNLGAGGKTCCFSDFGNMLPGKLAIVPASNNQSALPGSLLPIDPQVIVTDLGDQPIRNARVSFASSIEACHALADGLVGGELTDNSGNASTPWTLSSTPGPNAKVACGRGLAGEDVDGPRLSFDPFQPIQEPFDEADPPLGTVPELVLTGSVEFSATGVSPVVFNALYGAAFEGSGGTVCSSPCPASLYSIDPSTGTATLIGPIGFNRVGAMDFHPTTGVLYATGQNSDNTPVLIAIDVTTGAGSEVGATGLSGNIADVSFRSDGTLFVYDATASNHRLYKINLPASAATLVGSTGLGSNGGNGIGFDAVDVLYHSNRASSHTLSQTDGTATIVAAITLNPGQAFPPECDDVNGLRVAADDLDPGSNVFFGAIKCGSGSGTSLIDRIGTVDYLTGVITLIGPTISGLDALAFAPSGCGLCIDLRAGSSAKSSDLLVGPSRSRPNQPVARGPRAALPARPVQLPRQ